MAKSQKQVVETPETEIPLVAFTHEMAWEKNDEFIGEIAIEFSGLITVNGNVLNESATKFIIDWGFKQPLMNAYADPKKDAPAAFDSVLAKIIAGNVQVDSKKRINEEWAEMRVIIAPQLAVVLGYKDESAARKKMGKEWLPTLDAAVRKHDALVRPTAKENIAARKMPLGDALRASLAAELETDDESGEE